MNFLSKLSVISLPIRLSLFCVTTTVSIISFYLLLKNPEDEFAEEIAEKAILKSQYTRISKNIKQQHCCRLIGKDGCVIKSLRKEFQVQINFKKSEEEVQTMEISGLKNNVTKAEIKIEEIIRNIPEIISEVIQVPKSSVGFIIGKNGVNINEMKNASNCKIIIEKEQTSSKINNITLTGTKQQVEIAKELIFDKLNNDSILNAQRNLKIQQVQKDKTYENKNKDTTLLEYQQVFISAVENPHHFWCQFIKTDSSMLEVLNTKLKNLVDNNNGQEYYFSSLEEFDVGELVIGKFSADNAWYRAKVIEKTENELDLYFIDYGDSEWVKFPNSVRRLPDDLKEVAPQACEVSLSNILPINDNEWSEDAIDYFEKLTGSGNFEKILYALEIVDNNSEFKSITLIDTTNGDIDIGKQMIKYGFAKENFV